MTARLITAARHYYQTRCPQRGRFALRATAPPWRAHIYALQFHFVADVFERPQNDIVACRRATRSKRRNEVECTASVIGKNISRRRPVRRESITQLARGAEGFYTNCAHVT